MKKTFALLLAWMILITISMAISETLDIQVGTPSVCSLESFRLCFETMQKEIGNTFLWNENPGINNDYIVYSGMSEDGMTAAMIYTMNNCVACATVLGELSAEYSAQAGTEKLSTWLTTAISGMTFGFYLGENSVESIDRSELSDRFYMELLPLMSDMAEGMNDTEKVQEGIVCSSTILGFPTGLKIQGIPNSTGITLNISIFVTSPDGQIIIR